MKDFPKNINHENEYAQAVYEYLGITDGFFVDIGAFDGVKNNKTFLLEMMGWSGLAIEPHPTSFSKLQSNRGCVIEQVIISDEDGQSKFFYSEKAPMTSRVDMSGVQKRIHHMDDVLEISLPCFTLNSICEKHNVKKIDFLKIDTEGHDAVIVNSIDFSNLDIKLIMYEQWVNQDLVGYKIAEQKLIKNNFKLVSSDIENKIWFRL